MMQPDTPICRTEELRKAEAAAPTSHRTENIIQVYEQRPPETSTSTAWTTGISAILVIAGWYVANQLQASREYRKQIRERVSEILGLLHDLETQTIKYHTSDRAQTTEAEILRKLTRFESACQHLSKYGERRRFWLSAVDPEKLKIDSKVIQKFRQALTLRHFSGEHEGPIDLYDEVIEDIQTSAQEVSNRLEECRLGALD